MSATEAYSHQMNREGKTDSEWLKTQISAVYVHIDINAVCTVNNFMYVTVYKYTTTLLFEVILFRKIKNDFVKIK